MVSPGSYTQVVILSIIRSIQAPPGSSEPVMLNSTAPSGITVTFNPSSPVNLSANANLNVTLTIAASASTAVGNDTIKVQGSSGTNTQASSFTLRVVQYRVIMLRNTFIPAKLNITAGSTVYWQNIDGLAGGCGGGFGPHNVVFTTLPGANSSTLNQFDIYSYTFNTPGSYFYYSSLNTDHAMNGTINVQATGGGGLGMVSRMPAFSYFKGGDPAVITAPTPKTASSTNPLGAIAAGSTVVAGGLALATSLLSGGYSTFSGLGVEAGLAVIVGFLALAVAFAISIQGRRVTEAFYTAVTRANPSDSQ